MHSAAQRKNLSSFSGRRSGHGRFLSYQLLYLLAAILLLVPALASAAAGDLSLFGPKRFERLQGKPWGFTDSFNGCSSAANQALIRVQNGSSRESSLTSALISLNGANIFVEADFKNPATTLERTVTIRPGSNILGTQLKSGGQKETPFLVVTVIGLGCDSTPPVIASPQPADGALLATSRPVIAASYADNSGGAGIDTAAVRVVLDGADITTTCAIGGASVFCTPASPLPEGGHDVTLTVADLLQNSASLSWRFTTDTVAPHVAITAPGNGQFLASRSVTVSGSIDDPAATVTVNGKAAAVSGALFSVADVPLAEGGNLLTAVAVDPAGNRAESGITVTLDTSLPQITVVSPASGSFTNAGQLLVSGTVSEPVTALTLNGLVVPVSPDLTFSSTVSLAEGLNSLTIEVLDRAGNRGTAIVTVILDTVKPQISLTTPVEGLLTKNPALLVSGTVSEPVTALMVNSQPATVNGLSFTATLSLAEGPNTIAVETIDRAGNSGSATVTVTLDSTPPLAPVLEALATPTNVPQVTVSGSAEPDSNVSLYNDNERVATIVTPQEGRFSFPGTLLLAGENRFSVTALDPAGNESAPSAPVVVLLDTVKPTVGIAAPADKAILNTPVITVSGPIDDPTAAVTVNSLAALNSGGTWSLENFTLQEGENSLLVEAKDPAGNVGTAIVTVTLDTVQPSGTIVINGSVAITGSSRVNLTLSATDGSSVTTMQLSNDGSSWSGPEAYAVAKEWDLVPGDGLKSVFVKYLDRAGNWSDPVSATITLDTMAPVVSVAPAGGLYRSPQAITLAVSEAAAIYYTIDGTTPTVASAVYSQPVGIPASSTLSFFAKDLAGNQSPVKSESYTIDTIAPVVKVTSHANNQYLSTPAITLTGTLDDPTATVTVNGHPATVSGLTFTATLTLTEGANPITVSAIDPAGNSGTDSTTLNLDTIPPALTVSTLTDGSYTSSETLNVSGTVTDAGGLDRLLINGAVVPVNPDGSYSHALILTTGANAITVEAIDKAANKSSNSRTVNLDQTAPKITVTTPADNSKTGVKLIEVTGTVDEPVSSLTVNGQPVTVNGLSFTTTAIPAYGYNTIEIIAKDLAGNPGSQKRTVIFDDKKPAVAITVPAQDLRTNQASLLVKGTATDADGLTAVSVTVALDGASFTPAVTNGAFEQAVTFSEEKTYPIVVTARDEVGNETVTQRNVIYDVTPPQVTVTPFDLPVNQASQTIGGSREAGTTVVITSATAVIGTITYPTDTTWQATVTGLGPDSNDIVVTIVDAAGNPGSAATRIVYDTTPPAITVTAPAANAFLKIPQISVSGSVSEPVTAVTVNGQPATVNGLSYTAPLTLSEGANSIVVSAIDRAGNSGTLTVPVVLDTAPPVVTVTAPAANAFLKTPQLTVSGTISEPVTAVTVNGQPATVNGFSFTAPLTLAEGANSIVVSAIDRAGNSGTLTVPVTLDTLAPTVTIAAPASGLLTKTAQVTVSGTVSEENTTVMVNGQAATVGGLSYTAIITLVEGQNILTVTAADRAGNSGSAAVAVNLDATAPQAPLLVPLTTPTNVAAVTVSGTAEAGASVRITIAGAVIATVSSDSQGNFTLPGVVLTEGENSIVAIATDAAGNASQPSAPLAVLLDTVKPVITVTAPQIGTIINTAEVTISGTLSEPVTSVTVNGQPVTVNDLTFTTTMALAAGANSALIVATDPAGNNNSTTLSIQRDSTPPVVTITAPLTGLLTKTSAVQVTGTVDDAAALLTANGQPITVNGSTFSFTYTLSDGDNSISIEATDKAGNKGSASTSVTLDATAPVIAITAPAEAAAGANIAISLSASDNRQLTLVELRADGVPIWSAGSGPALAETIAYRLSPTLNAGADVTLQAKGSDSAGNEGSATAVIRIAAAAMGPGYLQGKVLEDGRGLVLEGAAVTIIDVKAVATELTAAADGGYFLETPAGSTLVKVAKPGYTTVERTVPVIPEKNIAVLDARLTKISDTPNLIDATGGVAKASPLIIHNSSFIIELTVPAGALASSADLRLTPISNQGLAGLLPLGWSPLAAIDIRSLDPQAGTPSETTLAVPATLTLPIPAGVAIDPAAPPMLARYDAAGHQWLAVKPAPVTSSTAAAEITTAGQYALVLADATNAPPAAAAGAPLAAAAAGSLDYAAVTATGKVVPQAAPPSTGLKAAGEVVLTAREGTTPNFTSGLVLAGRITETFDLKSGDRVETPVASQDLILYRSPCATSIGAGAVSALAAGAELRTTFPVAPSKDYSIVDLLLGKVGIEILKPDTSATGVMVGPDGGRLVDVDGNILNIPPGALGLTTPVSTKTVTPVAAIGSDFTLIRAVDVNLTRQTLAQPATLAIPAPQGLDQSLPLIVARQIDVKGVAKLKIVALARQSGTLITTEALRVGTQAYPYINTSGMYYFLQAKAPIGFVTGTISDAANLPFTGALVKTDRGSLVDLSAASGAYLLAAPVAPFVATALDLYKGDETTGASAITAANQAVVFDLKIEKIPPQVSAIEPANGSVNVQPTVPIIVTFSKAMDQSSINSTTLRLSDGAGTAVPGSLTFSVDSKTVTFYPADPFVQETSYTLTIAAAVKDLQGYPLGRDVVATFTVRKTTPPPMPPAGAISGTFPDADGFIGVTATQGSAPADCTVLLINDTSGEIASVTPQSNGSFSGRVRGQLGDEIKVVLMDYSGNQTTVSWLTFKSADNSYLVTAKGGKVEGEGGSSLDIPEGALVGPAVIKVTAVQEANLPSPLQAPGRFLGAVNVDTGGIPFKSEVKLSIPLPDGFNPATPVFVTRPAEVLNDDGSIEKVYEIIDSTKVVNGRITTASPPFDGVMGFGSYAFTAFPEVNVGIVDGYAYQEMNDQPGYQEPTSREAWDELKAGTNPADRMYVYDRPVSRAVIRTPAAWNYVSYANAKGFYAGMTTLYGSVGAQDLEYKVTGIHPLTMQKVTKTGYLTADGSQSRNLITNLNFKLADKGTVPPDNVPPVIDLQAALAAASPAGSSYVAGVATVNTELTVTLAVADKLLERVTLTLEFLPDQEGPKLVVPITLTAAPPQLNSATGINTYRYTPDFAAYGGAVPNSLKLLGGGIWRLSAEARDLAGQVSSKILEIRAVSPDQMAGSMEGAPRIIAFSPNENESEVKIDSPIVVWFSEAVLGVNEASFTLKDLSSGQLVPARVSMTSAAGRMVATLRPGGNLAFGTSYQISLNGSAITDATLNSGGALLNLTGTLVWSFSTIPLTAYELTDGQFTGSMDIALYNDNDSGGRYAYVTAGNSGWRVVNVTDPAKPQVVWPPADHAFPAPFSYRYVAVSQDLKLLAMTENIVFADGNQYGYIRFYDLTNPTSPLLVGQEKLAEAMSGIPGRIAIVDGLAYVSTTAVGLQVVDMAAAITRRTNGEPTDGSTIVGAFDTTAQGFGSPMTFIPYKAGLGVMTVTSGQLLTLDLSIPQVPTLLSSYQPENKASTNVPKDKFRFTTLAASPDYSYIDPASGKAEVLDLAVAGSLSGTVSTIDLSEPANPQVIEVVGKSPSDATPANLYTRDIAINAATGVAVATSFDAIHLIDIRDPKKPRILNSKQTLPGGGSSGTSGEVPLGSTAALVELDGWAYLANQATGMKSVNLGGELPCQMNPACGCCNR